MEVIAYATKRLDHLGIVSGICQEIDLIRQIDQKIGGTGRKVSVGVATQAMVLNALGFVGRPLYLTPEFFHNKALDRLLGPGIEAEDLNDDSLGRALDALYEAGVTEVFAQVAARALSVFGIEYRFAHLDSSSFSFYGRYERPSGETAPDAETTSEGITEEPPLNEPPLNEPQPVRITYGYSKDHRPDLKQVVLELICAQQSALPVWLAALDGNRSDKKSFPEAIRAYIEQLQGAVPPCFIADSALYSAANLSELSAVKWITRVPETIQEAVEALSAVPLETMEASVCRRYRTWETPSAYGGVEQRWILVHSEAAYQRDRQTLHRQIEKERQRAQRALEALPEAADASQARAAVGALAAKWRYHTAEVEVVAVPHYAKRGRPTGDRPPDRIGWQVKGQVEPAPERIEAALAQGGRFLLATNETDTRALSADQILQAYKGQNGSVERGFRFLKDPLFFAGRLFLKSPQRIMALLMVMGLSLLVYALAEHRVRSELKRRGETFPDPLRPPTSRPTLRRIFQLFEGIDVMYSRPSVEAEVEGETDEGGGGGPPLRGQVLNLTPLHLRLLVLFGPHVRKCYLGT